MTTASDAPIITAPRGTHLHCKGWVQEAALRMLMNNLDPEVAERPEDLVVYGGLGKAARNWDCFHAIVKELKHLGDDETLLVQSGKPVGVVKTHPEAPRVLIANSNLVPKWATWEDFRELDQKGLMMYGQMTAGSWIYIGSQGIVQGTYETFAEAARQHFGGTLAGHLDPHRGPRRHGRGPAPGRDHERRRGPLRRGGPDPHPEAPGDPLPGRMDRQPGRGPGPGAAGRGRPRGPQHRPPGQRRGGAARDPPARHPAGPRHGPDQRPRRVNGYIPAGLSLEQAAVLRKEEPEAYVQRALAPWGRTCEAMVEFQRRGAVTFDYGNNIRAQAKGAGFENAFAFPGFVPAFIRPLFCKGIGPFRWVALSGDPEDIAVTDEAMMELFPENEGMIRWLKAAQEKIAFQGLPARICWIGAGSATWRG